MSVRYVNVCLVVALAVVTVVFVSLLLLSSHPADDCVEDENWVAVDYRDPDGVEWQGVTRKCVNVDDLVGG